MKIKFTSKFLKSYKKLVSRRPETAVSVLQKVINFSQQPISPALPLHKLKGQLQNVGSFLVEKDLRIVDLKDSEKILFIDIGSQYQVY